MDWVPCHRPRAPRRRGVGDGNRTRTVSLGLDRWGGLRALTRSFEGEHLRRHDVRQTGLTWLADADVPVHVLRKIAGHGSLSTTQRYLHPDDRSITDAGDAPERPYLGAPVPKWSPAPSGLADDQAD